jgi:conjugal transfer mating pair stabilization protein TraG
MSHWQNDLSGNTFSANALTGRTAASLLRNQGFASRVVPSRVSEQTEQDASRQVDAAQGEAVTASREHSAVLAEAFTKGMSHLQSARHSTGTTSSGFEQWGESLSQMDQMTRSVAANTGLSQSQVASIAFGASGHLGIKTAIADGKLSAGANDNSERAGAEGVG